MNAGTRESIEALRNEIQRDRRRFNAESLGLMFLDQPQSHPKRQCLWRDLTGYPGGIAGWVLQDGWLCSITVPRKVRRDRGSDEDDRIFFDVFFDGTNSKACEKFREHACEIAALLEDADFFVWKSLSRESVLVEALFELNRDSDTLTWEENQQPGNPDSTTRIARMKDVFGTTEEFLTVVLKTSSANELANKPLEPDENSSSRTTPTPTVEAIDEAAGSFEVHPEFVRVCGFGEDVTLEKTEGVERLIAIVTAPTRRVSVMELAKIGAAKQASDRDQVDLDADRLTERESVNDDQFESVLGDGATQAAKDAIGDLIAERDAAEQSGDDEKAARLTGQIDASLIQGRSALSKAAKTVQNSLDRTYERFRKDGKGKELAAHFDKFVKRPRNSAEFVYEPNEAERKIVWTAK